MSAPSGERGSGADVKSEPQIEYNIDFQPSRAKLAAQRIAGPSEAAEQNPSAYAKLTAGAQRARGVPADPMSPFDAESANDRKPAINAGTQPE